MIELRDYQKDKCQRNQDLNDFENSILKISVLT
jgi:hypothetical protein